MWVPTRRPGRRSAPGALAKSRRVGITGGRGRARQRHRVEAARLLGVHQHLVAEQHPTDTMPICSPPGRSCARRGNTSPTAGTGSSYLIGMPTGRIEAALVEQIARGVGRPRPQHRVAAVHARGCGRSTPARPTGGRGRRRTPPGRGPMPAPRGASITPPGDERLLPQ